MELIRDIYPTKLAPPATSFVQTPHKKPIYLFLPKVEWMVLLAPLLLGLLSVYYSTLVYSNGSQLEQISRFVAQIFFFTGIHVAITILLLLKVKKIRESVFTSKNNPILKKLILASFIIGMAYYFGEVSKSTVLYPIIAALLLIYISYHNVVQSMGVSLLYNSIYHEKLNLGAEETKKLKKLEKRERWIIKWLFVQMLISVTYLNMTSEIAKNWAIKSLTLHALVSVILISWLMLSYHRMGQIYRNKVIFMIRYFFFANWLCPFNFFPTGVAHGTEYMAVAQKLLANSPQQKFKTWEVGAVLILFFAGGLRLVLNETFGVAGFMGVPAFFANTGFFYIVLVYSGIGYVHVYLDHMMFKRSGPIGSQLTADLTR